MYITPSIGSSAQQAKSLSDLEEMIHELKDTGIYFEEVKPAETSNNCTNIEIVQQVIDKYLTRELPKQVEEASGWDNYWIKEAFKELAEEDIKLMESYGIEL